MNIEKVFNRFMKEDFENYVIQATNDYLTKNKQYYVELFYDGSYYLKSQEELPIWPSKYSIFLKIGIFNSEEYENKCFDRVKQLMINSFYNRNNIFI